MSIPIRLALALSALAAATPVWAADEIHWTITGPTSVTFDWRGGDPSLAYGRSSAYGFTATGVAPSPYPFSSSGPFYEARLTNLTPGATYHYSIAGGADHLFHTPPASESKFVVYVESDIGDAPGSHTYVVDPALTPAAGMYWLRLIQSGVTRATKVAILR